MKRKKKKKKGKNYHGHKINEIEKYSSKSKIKKDKIEENIYESKEESMDSQNENNMDDGNEQDEKENSLKNDKDKENNSNKKWKKYLICKVVSKHRKKGRRKEYLHTIII